MHNNRYRLYASLGILALSGCSAITSTTNTAADAAHTIAHGMSTVSRASTDASVTEPDMPRYAQAEAYVGSQMPMLRVEAAAGGGEHVDALARLLDDPDSDALGDWMQAHYAGLFGATDDPHVLVRRIAARRG